MILWGLRDSKVGSLGSKLRNIRCRAFLRNFQNCAIQMGIEVDRAEYRGPKGRERDMGFLGRGSQPPSHGDRFKLPSGSWFWYILAEKSGIWWLQIRWSNSSRSSISPFLWNWPYWNWTTFCTHYLFINVLLFITALIVIWLWFYCIAYTRFLCGLSQSVYNHLKKMKKK